MKSKVFSAGTLLGFSLGGFFDGIVLHQILGWHHLICRTETCRVDSVAALEQQNREDGLFHLAMWVLTVGGVWALARSTKPLSGALFIGTTLLGWGAFNFFEGLIDHEILGLHHVYPRSPHYMLFDVLFLASGIASMIVGYRLVAKSDQLSENLRSR